MPSFKKKKNKELVRLLLSKGADPHTKDRDGVSPWMAAFSRALMLDVLLEHFGTLRPESKSKICSSNPETIHGAASKADSGVLRKLLRRGGDVNAVDGQRRTALHLAASNGHERLPSYYSTTNTLIWLRWIKETARRSTQLRWVDISQW